MSLLKSNQRLATIVAGVAILVIAGAITWGFSQQLILARQIQQEEARLEQEVQGEQDHYDDLTAHLEYVQSDEYVEYWARTEARMAKLGEIVVVMITNADEEPPTNVQPSLTAEPEE
jgi:cell division protein FtsB